MSKILAFLDLETTGLSPWQDYILEVAWVLTDENLEPVFQEGRSYLVDHPNMDDVHDKIESDPFIYNMHNHSGLRYDLAEGERHTLAQIRDAFLADVLVSRNAGDTVHMAGYSVGFDRSFLEQQPEWAPLFNSDDFGWQMHHRLLDLSGVKMIYDLAGRPIPQGTNGNPHRALDDVLETVEVAQKFKADLTL